MRRQPRPFSHFIPALRPAFDDPAQCVPWFDAEGVLAEEVTPFDGVMTSANRVRYLRPEAVPCWATRMEGRHGAALLRYDDGDTKIADILTVATGRLIRTINIVTDELYLQRVVLIYARVGA